MKLDPQEIETLNKDDWIAVGLIALLVTLSILITLWITGKLGTPEGGFWFRG